MVLEKRIVFANKTLFVLVQFHSSALCNLVILFCDFPHNYNINFIKQLNLIVKITK